MNWTQILASMVMAGQSLILNVISVPVLAYIIRQLGPDDFGQWSIAASLVLVATVFTNLGLRGSFVRSVAKDPDSAARTVADQLGIRLLLCLLAGGVAIGASIVLKYPPVVVMCTVVGSVGLLFATVTATLSDLLQGLHQISIYSTAAFVGGLALNLFSVLVIWLDYGPVALTVAYLASPALSTFLLWMFVQRKLFPVRIRFDLRRFWHLLDHSKYIGAQQLTNTLSANSEALLLPKLLGPAVFGFFSAGLLPALRLSVVPESLAAAFYPIIAKLYVRDRKAAANELTRTLLFSLAICLPVAVAVTLFSGTVAEILFPKDHEICQTVICITIWSLPLVCTDLMIGYGFYAAGEDALQAKYTLFASVLGFGLTGILVVKFGIIGACWSFVARLAAKIALLTYILTRKFALSLPVLRFAKLLASSGVMALSMLLMHELLPSGNFNQIRAAGPWGWASLLAALLAQGMVGIVVYAFSLVLMRMIRLADLAPMFALLPLDNHQQEVSERVKL